MCVFVTAWLSEPDSSAPASLSARLFRALRGARGTVSTGSDKVKERQWKAKERQCKFKE